MPQVPRNVTFQSMPETKTPAEPLFTGRGSETIRRLIEAVPDAMVIADAKGGIVLVNTHAELLFGYDAQELLGQSVEVLVPESLRHKHVQHRDEFRAEPRTRPMGSGLELFGRRKDGSVFPIEISLSPTEDADGFFVTASIRDISDRKKAQEALRQSEERFRLLVAEVNVFIGVFNLLPILPLDGGHIAILLYEEARKRAGEYRRLIAAGIELIEQSAPAREAKPAGKVRIEHLPRPGAHF